MFGPSSWLWPRGFSNISAAPHCHPSASSHKLPIQQGQFLLSLKTKLFKALFSLLFHGLYKYFFQRLKYASVTTVWDWSGLLFIWTGNEIHQAGAFRKSVLPHQRPWKQHACPEREHRRGCEGPLSPTRHPGWWVSWQPSRVSWASLLKMCLRN